MPTERTKQGRRARHKPFSASAWWWIMVGGQTVTFMGATLRLFLLYICLGVLFIPFPFCHLRRPFRRENLIVQIISCMNSLLLSLKSSIKRIISRDTSGLLSVPLATVDLDLWQVLKLCKGKKAQPKMNRIFGKKKAPGPPPPSLDDASSGLGGRVDAIDAKIESLEKELKGYKDKIKKAKSPAAKKTLQKRAMEVLKRKRMYEGQRDQVAGQQFNVDQAAFQMESAKATIGTVAALKSANTELKRTIQKDLDISDVDELADDMAELMDDMNEINEALGQNFATPEDLDEADLDAELELLEDELEEEGELEEEATPSYLQEPSLPAHPTGVPGGKTPATQVDEYGLPMTS